jgi:hypothetical protein
MLAGALASMLAKACLCHRVSPPTLHASMRVLVCFRVLVRACVRARERACVRASERASVRGWHGNPTSGCKRWTSSLTMQRHSLK